MSLLNLLSNGNLILMQKSPFLFLLQIVSFFLMMIIISYLIRPKIAVIILEIEKLDLMWFRLKFSPFTSTSKSNIIRAMENIYEIISPLYRKKILQNKIKTNYKIRRKIENFFAILKENKRLVLRYEKSDLSFLSFSHYQLLSKYNLLLTVAIFLSNYR